MAHKILVIDDEPDVLKYLETVLGDDGYEVQCAASGEEGFAITKKWKPDLICLDIMMPRQSGIALYRKMHESEDTRKIPVIILTGIETGDNFDFHRWVGDDKLSPPEYFLEKPIKVKDFLDIVANVVGRGRVKSR